MKRHLGLMAVSLGFFAYTSHAAPKSKLNVSQLFSDHMVVQQKNKVEFWGKSEPGQKLTITAGWGKKANTQADTNGRWKTTLPTPKAGGPYDITIKTADSTIFIKDVLVGEVWLASGQSNMDINVRGWLPKDTIFNSKQEIAEANFPNIRILKVPFGMTSQPLDSLSGGAWYAASPQTVGDFSATAYFYAKELHQKLGVPVGMIVSCVGGTPAESWTSQDNLAKLDNFNSSIDELSKLEKSFKSWFEGRPTKKLPQSAEEWQNIEFSDVAAAANDFDDSNWLDAKLPGRIDVLPSGEFDGAIWFRRNFEVKDLTSDYLLKIEAIDDFDATFINGQKVGGLAGDGVANAPREMLVPKSLLKQGINTIAIRAIDSGGPGYINGVIRLTNANETINLEGNWKSHLIAEIHNGKFYIYPLTNDTSKRPNVTGLNNNSPTVLYNAMINPLVPYTIKGVIWYQGESNVGRAEQYKRIFPLMIKDWREKWGYEFPFYFAQIAPFLYGGYQEGVSQELRNAQRLALKTPKTGMAVLLDKGRLDSAHPAFKQDVASRLARFAFANDYGIKMVTSGPLYQRCKNSGNELIVEFNTFGSPLKASEAGLFGFQVAGADKVFYTADARIKNNTIVLNSSSVETPIYARYAWSDGASASLFNAEGLPASTFTSVE